MDCYREWSEKSTRTLLLVAAVWLSSLLWTPSANAQQKIAFLVGVEKYEKKGFDDLQFAEDDVVELGDSLAEIGFETRVLLGEQSSKQRATAAGIQEQIDDWLVPKIKRLKKEDILVVVLSGHGQQKLVNNREDAFFCPVDAHGTDDKTWISISQLMQRISHESGSLNNLFLIDACRNNPNKGMRGVDGRNVDWVKDNIAIFFAASYGQQARELERLKHGVFTYHLIDGLKGAAADQSGEVSWYSLVDYVTKKVSAEPDTQQRPNVINNLSGRLTLTKVKSRRVEQVSSTDLEAKLVWPLGKAKHERESFAPEFSQDGSFLCESNCVFDSSNQNILHCATSQLTLSKDNEALLEIGETLRVFDVKSGKLFNQMKVGRKHVLDSNCRLCAVAEVREKIAEIKIYDIRSGQSLGAWSMPDAPLEYSGDAVGEFEMVFSPDSQHLWVKCLETLSKFSIDGREIRSWQVPARQVLRHVTTAPHIATLTDLAVTSASQLELGQSSKGKSLGEPKAIPKANASMNALGHEIDLDNDLVLNIYTGRIKSKKKPNPTPRPALLKSCINDFAVNSPKSLVIVRSDTAKSGVDCCQRPPYTLVEVNLESGTFTTLFEGKSFGQLTKTYIREDMGAADGTLAIAETSELSFRGLPRGESLFRKTVSSNAIASQNGEALAMVNKGGTLVEIFKMGTAATVKIAPETVKDAFLQVALSFDGSRLLISGYNSKSVDLFDAQSGKLIRTFNDLYGTPSFLSTDGRIIGCVAGGRSRRERAIDTLTNKSFPYCLVYSKARTIGIGNNVVRKVDSESGVTLSSTPLQFLDDYGLTGQRVAFSPDERFIIATDHEGALNWWDVNTGKKILRYMVFGEEPEWLAYCPNDNRYDGTERGLEYLCFTKKNETLVVPKEKLSKALYTPGLVAEVLGTKEQ